MDEYSYSILYKKEILDTNKYLFIPCYVVKGLYDKEENIFLDELNKSRFLYTDINIIQEQCNYCVGEVYTEEQLRKKFPNANSLEDLKIKLFEEQEKKVTIGYYHQNSTNIQISSIADETKNDFQMQVEATSQMSYYQKMKQKLGTDFSIFLQNHIEELLAMDDVEDIKTYIKKREEARDCYEQEISDAPSNNIATIIGKEVIDQLLKMETPEEIKESIQYYFNSIEEEITNQYEATEPVYDIISEKILDIEEIVELTDSTYHQIKESNNKEEVINLLEYLLGNYLFTLDILEVCKQQGKPLYKSLTYFCVQTQLLERIEREEDLDILKAKYKQFYHLTRKNLEGVKEEFRQLPGDFVIEEKLEPTEKEIEKEIESAMDKLNCLVGMKEVKESLEEIFDIMLFKKKTKDNLCFEEGSKHMVFIGNPGAGKTTVAEIIAPLFYQLGYLKSNKVAYVSAQDLIGKYVGHTAPKTEEVIKKNKGGLIVLDEAYILARDQHFGNEAITVMLKEMEKNQTMFIFVGYKKEMEDFIRMNSGLESRIGIFLEFKDYTEEELMEIFKQNIDKVNSKENQKYQLTITEEALEKVQQVLNKAKEIEDFGNGRFVKKLFDTISKQHAKNTRHTTKQEDLYQITEQDIPENVLEKIFFNQGKRDNLYSESNMGFGADIDKRTKRLEKRKSLVAHGTGSY